MKLMPVHLQVNALLSDSLAIKYVPCSFSLNIEHDFLVLYVEADVVGLGFQE